MNRILNIKEEGIQKVLEIAKECVLRGKVIVYPTDTVYGIGGNAKIEKVVERVRQIKRKTANIPFSVILSDIQMITEYCQVDEWQYQFLKAHLPGPYTFILKEKKKLPISRNGKIGVRIPESQFAHQLSEITNVPIITTSANITGVPPPASVEEISEEIIGKVELVVNNGLTKHRGASAVVDLVEKQIIRKGVGKINL